MVVNICREWLLILNHLIHERKKNKFGSLTYRSQKVFLQKITEIKINMKYLDVYILDLVFWGLIFGERGLEKHKYVAAADDMKNILALNVLMLFKKFCN